MTKLKLAQFKTKKDLYNILKTKECYTKRKFNIEEKEVNKFLQYYDEEFIKNIDYFKSFVLKYIKQDELNGLQEISKNEEDCILIFTKRLYRNFKFTLENQRIVSIKNKTEYLLLKDINKLYKTDFIIFDNKILTKDSLVTYEVYIKEFLF